MERELTVCSIRATFLARVSYNNHSENLRKRGMTNKGSRDKILTALVFFKTPLKSHTHKIHSDPNSPEIPNCGTVLLNFRFNLCDHQVSNFLLCLQTLAYFWLASGFTAICTWWYFGIFSSFYDKEKKNLISQSFHFSSAINGILPRENDK